MLCVFGLFWYGFWHEKDLPINLGDAKIKPLPSPGQHTALQEKVWERTYVQSHLEVVNELKRVRRLHSVN